MKIDIKKYNSLDKKFWDEFIPFTSNGTFLHQRDYMDYHKDRFEDFSLMIYSGNRLLALFPAHIEGKHVISHSGLTYGDVLLDKKLKSDLVYEILQNLFEHLKNNNINQLEIKAVPVFFKSELEDNSVYHYWKSGGVVQKIQAYYLVDAHSFRLNTNRKRNINKIRQNKDLTISTSKDLLPDYWELLSRNLRNKHNALPVHTLDEMDYLMRMFPENIGLYTVSDENKLLAGIVVYKVNQTLHFQYIGAVQDPEERNSIDYLTYSIIKENIGNYKYISLGSAENTDGSPNHSLIYWKESFGAKVLNQLFFTFKF